MEAKMAASRPFCAARPGWKDLVWEPNCSRRPVTCVDAMPRACEVWSMERLRSLDTAVAAPIEPVVDVICLWCCLILALKRFVD